MKKRPLFTVHIIIISVLFILLANSCKKDDDETTVTDIDGNFYNTVTIGSQVWMKENLKTTKFNDGTEIQVVTGYIEWFNLNTPGYCWYDNDEAANKKDYGALYNWYAIETGKLCPSGWHVPSDEDWQKLALFIDPNAGNGFSKSTIAGGKLKEKGTEHWSSPNDGASDEYGFSSLPGGCRLQYEALNFNEINEYGFWWSSTSFSDDKAWIVDMGYNYTTLYRYNSFKINGNSVRCVKD